MTGNKHPMLKAAMLIILIVTLNLLGISYGYWQDGLISSLKAQIGDIELSFVGEPVVAEVESEESKVFSNLTAELENGDKTILITGKIENGKDGEFELGYSVLNHGSLPIEFDDDRFDEFMEAISQIEGFTLYKYNGSDINQRDNSSESITIQINASKLDYTPVDDPGSDDSELDGTEETSNTVLGYYDFEIVLPYYFSSWSDELNITGSIDIVESASTVTTMLAPVPAMTFIPVQGEIVTGGLPDGPSDEKLYGEGKTAVETDESESTVDEELYDIGETTGADDGQDTIESDSEQESEDDDAEEGPVDEELYDTGGTESETDEQEAIENDSEQSSEDVGEEEVTSEESEEDDGDEAAQEDSEPADEIEGEEEGSGEQVQDDSGEPQPDAGENN